jgi:GNAT superfamily N-acetyltransferase
VRIRKALAEDAAALKRVVDEARRSSGYPKDWIDLVQRDFSISPEFISTNEIYVAEESGESLGFYVLTGNKLEDLWIAPAHFGTGVGKELFLHAKEKAARRC